MGKAYQCDRCGNLTKDVMSVVKCQIQVHNIVVVLNYTGDLAGERQGEYCIPCVHVLIKQLATEFAEQNGGVDACTGETEVGRQTFREYVESGS